MTTKQFSLNDFKKWLSEQNGTSDFFSISKDPEDPNAHLIGNQVQRNRISNEDIDRGQQDKGEADRRAEQDQNDQKRQQNYAFHGGTTPPLCAAFWHVASDYRAAF